MTYDFTDAVIRYLDKRYIEMFSRLKGLVSFDELNVMQSVNNLYAELHTLIRKMFRQLADQVYQDTCNKPIRQIDDEWIERILNDYDPVTKYVFSHEEDRRAARLIEAIIASTTKTKEIDAAMKSWSLMSREFAVRVTDKAVTQAYNDDGEAYARWVTERDEQVCRVCKLRDRVIYELAYFPAKPHINCRCRRERVIPDD